MQVTTDSLTHMSDEQLEALIEDYSAKYEEGKRQDAARRSRLLEGHADPEVDDDWQG